MEKIIIKASTGKRLFWLSMYGLFALGAAVMPEKESIYWLERAFYAAVGLLCGGLFFAKFVTFSKEILTIESTGFTYRSIFGFSCGFISWGDVRTIALDTCGGLAIKYILVMVSDEEVLIKNLSAPTKNILKYFIRARGLYLRIQTLESCEKAEKIFTLLEQYYYADKDT